MTVRPESDARHPECPRPGEPGPAAPEVPVWNGPDADVIRRVPGGPVLVRGPVRIPGEDGQEIVCDRFVVAVCRCRLSSIHPLCDTSHRRLRERRQR